MKYEDIDNLDNRIINNDYVSYDVKPARRPKELLKKIKSVFDKDGSGNLLILPLMALTAISLGFLIAQVAKYASLSALTSILT